MARPPPRVTRHYEPDRERQLAAIKIVLSLADETEVPVLEDDAKIAFSLILAEPDPILLGYGASKKPWKPSKILKHDE